MLYGEFDGWQTIYGLTEATGVIFQSLPGEASQLTEDTIGHLANHVEVMVSKHPFASPRDRVRPFGRTSSKKVSNLA